MQQHLETRSSGLRTVISGYYGYGNAGDEAILEGIVQSIRSEFPDCEITVISGEPTVTKALHGIEAIHVGLHHEIGYKSRGSHKTYSYFKNYINILNKIRDADCVIVGGGGIIHDWYGASLILKNLEKGILAKVLGRKTALYGVGVGPLRKSTSKYLTRLLINFFDIILVRDEESHKLLKSIGVKKYIFVTADPALVLKRAPEHRIQEILKAHGISQDKPTVIFCLRSWFHYKEDDLNLKRKNESFITKIVELCDYVSNELNSNPILLAFQPMKDSPLYGKIIKRMTGENRPILIDDIISPSELKGIISNADLLIGMRLHSLIFAASESVPFIALAYDDKINNFVGRISNDIPVYDIQFMEVSNIKKDILSIINSKEPMNPEDKIAVQTMVKGCEKNMELLKKLLQE